MSVVLELEPDIEAALAKKANAEGLKLSAYVEDIVRKEIVLDEILAPVRKQYADSGMTEDDLDDFFTDIRQKAFNERYPDGRP